MLAVSQKRQRSLLESQTHLELELNLQIKPQKRLTKLLVEKAPDAEMANHLGHDKSQPG